MKLVFFFGADSIARRAKFNDKFSEFPCAERNGKVHIGIRFFFLFNMILLSKHSFSNSSKIMAVANISIFVARIAICTSSMTEVSLFQPLVSELFRVSFFISRNRKMIQFFCRLLPTKFKERFLFYDQIGKFVSVLQK